MQEQAGTIPWPGTRYDPSMPLESHWSRIAFKTSLLVLAIAYTGFLLRHTCFFASGPDSSGYLNEARLFASGRLRVPVEPLRELGVGASMVDVFVPLGFFPGPAGTMVPTYAPGLPILMVLFASVGGWAAGPFLIPPLAALGCLFLLHALAREIGLSSGWAILAPLLLAPAAVFITYAMQPMSDVVATFWVLLAIGSGFRSRRDVRWAYLAGAALAVAVAVRPTNALAALPLLIAMPFALRSWLGLVLGGLVPGTALLWLNHVQYGSPFRFGFASVADVLTVSPPGICAGFHLWWTVRMLTVLTVALALMVLLARGVPLRHRGVLVSWFGVFFAFYSFYSYCPNWTANRFLLPAFPSLILAALLALQSATTSLASRGRARAGRVLACLCILLIIAGQSDQASEFRVFRIDDHESVFPETVEWTRRMVPENALVVSGVFSGVFYYYGRWTVRWDLLDADRFMLLRAYAGNANRRWYAVISDGEVAREEFLRRLPGVWTAIGRNRDVTLYRLDS